MSRHRTEEQRSRSRHWRRRQRKRERRSSSPHSSQREPRPWSRLGEILCPSTIPCARDSQKRDMPELRKERVSWMKTGEMAVSSEEAGDGEEAGEDVRKESY
jgi:hypothetical protein